MHPDLDGPPRTATVATTPGRTRSTQLAVLMYAMLLLAYVVNAMDRQLFPVLATDVRSDLGFTLPQSGLQTTIFTLGMGLAGIPTGILLARSSRRAVVLIGLAVFSAATLATAFATGFWDLLAYRFASGLGEAMQLTALMAIASAYFVRRRAVAVAAVNFTFGVGALIGPNLGAAIRDAADDWRVPLIVFGILGFIILLLVALTVRPWLTEAHTVAVSGRPLDDAGAASLLERNPVLLAIATVFAGLAIYAYLGLYPTYLRDELGYSTGWAGLALSMYGLGALVSLFGGWLGDRYDFRKLLAVALTVSAVSGYILFSGMHSKAGHLVFSFIFGAAISGIVYANLAAGIIKSIRRPLNHQGSGLFVAALYIPAAFAGYLLGALADGIGWTAGALIVISGFCLISAGLALAVRRRVAVPAALQT